MSGTPVTVRDPDSKQAGKVSKFGEQIVGALDFSTPVFKEVTLVNTAFNFIVPKPSQDIIITDIIINTDRAIPVPGARIEIYEALSASSLAAEENIVVADLTKQVALPLTGLNMRVPGGRWVNAKSDGTNVLITIMFYRAPVVRA